MNNIKYIGIDVHQATSVFATRDHQGNPQPPKENGFSNEVNAEVRLRRPSNEESCAWAGFAFGCNLLPLRLAPEGGPTSWRSYDQEQNLRHTVFACIGRSSGPSLIRPAFFDPKIQTELPRSG